MKELLDLLHSKDFYGVSNTVDIAKGKHELITDWKDVRKKIKRVWQSKRL